MGLNSSCIQDKHLTDSAASPAWDLDLQSAEWGCMRDKGPGAAEGRGSEVVRVISVVKSRMETLGLLCRHHR